MNTIKLVQLDGVLFTSDSSGELHVSDHDGHSLSVDGAKVGVLEETNEVSLSSLLEGEHSLRLESDVILDLSSEVFNDSLEWQLPDEEVSLS